MQKQLEKALNGGSLSCEMKNHKTSGKAESDTYSYCGPEMALLVLIVQGPYSLPNYPTQKVAKKAQGKWVTDN